MNVTNGDGAELYALVQRLLQLQEGAYAHRVRMEYARREIELQERRCREEEDKIRCECAVTLKAIREKLGVSEPSSSEVGAETPASSFDLNLLFGDFFAQFGKKPNESPLK